MQLWKKMKDLMVTGKLTVGKGANLFGFDKLGNLVPVGVGVVEARAAASELTSAENGKTILLNSTTAFATTLPLPFLGGSFKFVVAAVPGSGSHTVVTNGSANIIKGSVSSADLNAASDSAIATGADTIGFVTAKTVAGDYVELVSDGTSWFMSGNCSVFDAITQAAT